MADFISGVSADEVVLVRRGDQTFWNFSIY